jgi:hypothetical protein
VSCDLYSEEEQGGLFYIKTFGEVFNKSGTGCFIQTAGMHDDDARMNMEIRIAQQRGSYD